MWMCKFYILHKTSRIRKFGYGYVYYYSATTSTTHKTFLLSRFSRYVWLSFFRIFIVFFVISKTTTSLIFDLNCYLWLETLTDWVWFIYSYRNLQMLLWLIVCVWRLRLDMILQFQCFKALLQFNSKHLPYFLIDLPFDFAKLHFYGF